MKKRRVVGRIYGMKYSWKSHKHRTLKNERLIHLSTNPSDDQKVKDALPDTTISPPPQHRKESYFLNVCNYKHDIGTGTSTSYTKADYTKSVQIKENTWKPNQTKQTQTTKKALHDAQNRTRTNNPCKPRKGFWDADHRTASASQNVTMNYYAQKPKGVAAIFSSQAEV